MYCISFGDLLQRRCSDGNGRSSSIERGFPGRIVVQPCDAILHEAATPFSPCRTGALKAPRHFTVGLS
jgi:hypothetical protein